MNISGTVTSAHSSITSCLLATLVAGICATFATGTTWAEGLRNPPPGSFAMARGLGRVTHVDDATAVFVNPANMLDLDSSTIAVTPAVVDIEREVDADWGGEASTIDNLKALGGVFAAFPGSSGNLAWGIGLSVPYGQSVVYDEDFDFKYLAPHFTELMVVSVSPAIAYRLNDSISVGASVDLMWSRLRLRQSYPWSAVTGNAASPDGDMYFKATDTAVGGIVALNWDINTAHRISVTYRPSFEVSYDGEFQINNLPAFAPALGVTETSDFRTSIEYPDIWTLGYGVELGDRWRLGIAVERLGWSAIETLELDVGNNAVLFPGTTLPQYWNDTWTWGVSGDYRASDSWTFSGGYWFIETPIPEWTQAPNLMESDIAMWSLGAKREFGRHSLGLSFTLMLYDDRVITDNVVPAYNGSYDTTANIYQLTYSFNF